MQALAGKEEEFRCSVFRAQEKAHKKIKSKPSEAGLIWRGGRMECCELLAKPEASKAKFLPTMGL